MVFACDALLYDLLKIKIMLGFVMISDILIIFVIIIYGPLSIIYLLLLLWVTGLILLLFDFGAAKLGLPRPVNCWL